LLAVIIAASGFFITARTAAGQAFADFCRVELARDFISFQHRSRGLEYDVLEVYTTVNLYDEEHNVAAKAVIIDRDGEFDYVIINLITEQIDEWGINEGELAAHFKSGERIYFGGALTFSVREDGEYVDFNGVRLDRTEFVRRTGDFREVSRHRRDESRRQRTITSSNPNDGLLSWLEIVGRHHSHTNIDFRYLYGIGRNGITGERLSFTCQLTLNIMHFFRHGLQPTGTCGPTMQVNLLIYLRWRGFNVMINNSIDDTFDRTLVLTNWRPGGGTSFTANINSMRTILTQQGYNYTMQTLGSSFAGFRNSILNGHPAMMQIHLGSAFGHGVVVVGFEHFRHGTANFHYLRIIDGWESSNAGRFVDFNGFFNGISGASFWIV